MVGLILSSPSLHLLLGSLPQLFQDVTAGGGLDGHDEYKGGEFIQY